MILAGAMVLDLHPPAARRVDVRVKGGRIVEVGPSLTARPGESVEDLGGRWLMPGLVCAHHHLYSALSTGMPLRPEKPTSFTHMLELVWWRLDRALDLDAVGVSAEVGGLAALRAGVTTIIDHHASPSAIVGSLEAIDGALAGLGLRRVLCYEVTDRGGAERARAGLRAHERLLAAPRDGRRAILVGAHASFTLSDDTLTACAALARDGGVGLHLHAAEAIDDASRRGESPVKRLDRLGALLPGSILAHGVHLDADDLARVQDAGAWITHQPRSNMNNAVGYAPVARFGSRTAVGTDGIGADMLAEAQCGYFRSQEGQVGWGPGRWCAALAAASTLAGDTLGIRLGRVAPGYAADLVVLDPCPGPPLTKDNLPAALIFRFSAAMVRDVMVDGAWRLKDRYPVGIDVGALDRRAQAAAMAVWARMV